MSISGPLAILLTAPEKLWLFIWSLLPHCLVHQSPNVSVVLPGADIDEETLLPVSVKGEAMQDAP